MELSELKINPNNPRQISQDEKAKLKDSINGFEKMLKAHPIVVDENNVILSGNQRYQCLIELDYKQIPDEWVKKVTDFTEKEKKEFMVKMNTHAGSFDYEMFEDEFWDDVEFEEWVEREADVDLNTHSEENNQQTDLSDSVGETYEVIIECKGELEQEEIFYNLTKKGYSCRVLTL